MLFCESTAIPVGEVNPVTVGQVVEEQEVGLVPEGIFVTELPVLLVTQTLPEVSTAIPVGEEKEDREKFRQVFVVQPTEKFIVERISVTELPLLYVTQTL
jgi:hypothetical protein